MNCPNCGREMEQGFFQVDNLLWAKRIHKLALTPEEKGEFYMRGSLKTGCCYRAYICQHCNHILFDYEDGRIYHDR